MARKPIVGDNVGEDVGTESESSEATAERVLPTFSEINAALSAKFDTTYQRQIPGGKSITYITGEQAVTRLTEVVPGWDWQVDKAEVIGDDVLVSGTLTIGVQTSDLGFVHAYRAGYGGAKVKKMRASGDSLDLGNDVKAAETSAFKRAASKFGVGLYLYERDESELPSAGEPTSYGQPGSYTPQANRAPVQYAASSIQSSADGTTKGTIKVINKMGTGLILDGNENWWNVSRNHPVDLSQFQRGQQIVITHNPANQYIDAIAPAGSVAADVSDEITAF